MNEALIIDECETPHAAFANTACSHWRDGIDTCRVIPGELERRDRRFGLVTMCTGCAMAPAIILEEN